jgi:ABC-2 type transport system permease protein
LAWRLHRGAVLGWSVGIALFAVVWGGLADTLGDLFEENPQLADIFEALGGTGALTEVFFAAAMGIVALIVSGYSIGAALRMQSEENGLRAEHILATPTPRLNWAGSHVLYALVGPVLLMALAGLAAGATYGAITGDIAGWMTDLFESALLYVPAIWVLAGIAVLLYGLAPRFTALSWGVLVASLLLGQLGPILQLPQWSMDLSPFTHVPTPPESVSTAPLLLLTAVGGSLVAIGVRGFERRDLR